MTTINLKQGQSRGFTCGPRPRNKIHVIIESTEALIVTCRTTEEVVAFRCTGLKPKRRSFLLIPNNTRVVVTCRKNL